jgi:hypothetical protein
VRVPASSLEQGTKGVDIFHLALTVSVQAAMESSPPHRVPGVIGAMSREPASVFKGFSRYIPVSVMKCASQPAVLSRGPRALIYFFSLPV